MLKLIFGLVSVPFVSLTGWLFGQIASSLPPNISDIGERALKTTVVDVGSNVAGALAMTGVIVLGLLLLICLVEIRQKINQLPEIE